MSLYSIEIIQVGECALDALEDDMLILFNQSVPEDAAEYCFVHSHDELRGNVAVGGEVVIDSKSYPITAVGDAVNQNLGNLGHITLRFDSATQADFLGSLHLTGTQPRTLSVGSTISFN